MNSYEEEEEEFKRLEEKLARSKNPMNLFKELVIGDVVLRLYPTHDGWSWYASQKELEWVQGLIDESLADRKLNSEPFAHVMVYENDVKHCVTADTKGAVPVYTKESA
jgi:hypothetical protein